MAPLLKSLRQVANDFRPNAKPRAKSRVVPLITLAQMQERRMLAAVAMAALVCCVLAGVGVWYFHKDAKGNIETETKMMVAAQPTPATAVQSKKPAVAVVQTKDAVADISLPAENLSPDADPDMAPAPDADPAINIVAQKLGDLPVMGAAHTSQTTASDILPDEDDVLADAHTMLESGDYVSAMVLYDRVLAAHGTSRAALAGKAFAQQRSAQYDDAIATLHRLARMNPDDAVMRTNLAAALGRSQSSDAFIELEKMVEASPDFAPAQAAYAHMLAQEGNMPEALEHLDRAARLQPSNMSYRLELAILYDRAGHAPEAFALYQQIIRINADQDDAPPLPVSLNAIRQRVDYLAMRMDANASLPPPRLSPSDRSGAGAE